MDNVLFDDLFHRYYPVLNILTGFVGMGTEYADQAASRLGAGVGFLVLGLFLISRANKKKQQEEERQKWRDN